MQAVSVARDAVPADLRVPAFALLCRPVLTIPAMLAFRNSRLDKIATEPACDSSENVQRPIGALPSPASAKGHRPLHLPALPNIPAASHEFQDSQRSANF